MKSWKTSFTALLIAQTFARLGFGLSANIIALFLEEDLGITDPARLNMWVGYVISAGSFFMMIFAPIWGYLADIFSRKAMLLRAMFGGGIIISLTAFVVSPWQFLLLRSIQGCVIGTVAAATVLTVGIVPAAQVAFALGLLQAGIYVGNSLGPAVGGFLSDFLSYRAAFFFTGVTLLISGVIVLFWVHEGAKAPRDETVKRPSFFKSMLPVFKSPVLMAMMLATFGVNAASSVATPMLALFVKSLIAGPTGEAAFIASITGIVVTVSSAFTALAAFLSGKISTRIGYWTTLILCLIAGAALTFPQTFVVNIPQLIILRALSSFFIGGSIPVINAIIAVSAEKNTLGSVYGVNTFFGAAAATIGPLIATASAMISYRAIFVSSAIILGFTACQAGWLKKRNA
jgi:DHA1 family multidrug resistance protein-like MFS transporter